MAKFLKANTKLVGRNEIKDHVKNMGISLCAGEVEAIYYRMLALSTDGSGDEIKTEPKEAQDTTVKTDPDCPQQVHFISPRWI